MVAKRIVYRMVPTGSYIVYHKMDGELNRYVTIDRAKAEEYAQKWHGEMFVCFIEKGFEVDVPEEQNETARTI